MAGIIYDQKMVGTGVFEKGSDLSAQLDARVRYRGNRPPVGVVIVPLVEHLLQPDHVMFYRFVLLPPQHQDGNGAMARLERLLVDVHSSILKMPGKSLEVMAFWLRRRDWLGSCELLWRKLHLEM